jgi:hypothetical protein
MESTLDVPFDARPGQWPLVATVDYADANGHPFQALQVALIATGNATPSLVVLTQVDAAPVRDTAPVRARLKSLSEIPRQAQVRFITPRGLEITPATHALPLAPWADAQVEAQVVNRAVLAGSRYPVFATLEYDDAGTHHAALASGVVEIRGVTPKRDWYPLAVAVTLLAIWVVVLVVRRLRAPRAS